MSQFDRDKVLEQARVVQQRIEELQKELNLRRFEASAGGGMVKVTMTGALRVVAIDIEDAFFKAGDREMIQDLTAAAVNAVIAKAQEGANDALLRIQQQMVAGGA